MSCLTHAGFQVSDLACSMLSLLPMHPNRRKNAPSEASIFQCISMLATAVGQALTKHMHELLELMFAYGLSEALVRALDDLSTHIPPLLPTIQERLLNLLCLILSGEPFKTPGAPLMPRPTASSITKDLAALSVSHAVRTSCSTGELLK